MGIAQSVKAATFRTVAFLRQSRYSLSLENKQDNLFAPFAALLAVQASFGSLPVIGKVVLAVIPAVALVGMRVGITALILFVVQLTRGRIRLKETGDYWRLAVLSLFGVTFNQLMFITGLSMTKAANASLLAVTIPIFALTIGSLIGVEKLRPIKFVGIIVAAAGVIFLIDPRVASFSSQTTIGDMLIILNSLSYGLYVATSKSVVTRNGAFRSIMWIFIFASIICVPLGAISISSVDVSAVSTQIWMMVLYIAVAVTAVPYFLNAWALARVNPSTVAVFVYLQPLIGFIFAVIFLGETVDSKFIVAAGLVFIGVFVVTKKYVPSET